MLCQQQCHTSTGKAKKGEKRRGQKNKIKMMRQGKKTKEKTRGGGAGGRKQQKKNKQTQKRGKKTQHQRN
jgi:hypothetical protein